jgi:hypothetical protein
MTPELRRSRLLAALKTAILRYDKLGILIDDQRDAASRLARELYLAEVLPEYWVTVRSIPCANAALAFLRDNQVVGPSTRCIVIVDRYLLEECPDSSRRVPIDGQDSPAGPNLENLANGGLGQNVLYWLVSNRPVGSDQASKISWLPRSPWIMADVRRRLGDERFAPLRRFGPERSAGATDEDFRAKADSWDATLKALAERLAIEGRGDEGDPNRAGGTPVVLLTGAGASLASSRLGPGIPATNTLLYEAARRQLGLRTEERSGPPEDEAPCACGASEPARPGAGGDGREDQRPPETLKAFLDVVAGSSGPRAVTYPSLLRLFEPDGDDLFRSFYGHFRSVMQRFDHGFPYQHWLMAQLPWTCIVTTNFDCFHERAAAAAALRPDAVRSPDGEREDVGHLFLRRGNPFFFPPREPGGPPQKPLSPKDWKRLWRECRLFKPYGTLVSPGALVLNRFDFEAARERFRQIFKHLFGGQSSGWLVVVGHAMLDPGMQEELATYLPGLRLLWVVPEAHRVVRGDLTAYEGKLREWPNALRDRMKHVRSPFTDWRAASDEHERGGPLRAGALEFLYDLTLRMNERRS